MLFPHASKMKHPAAGNKQTESAQLNSKLVHLAANCIKGQMLMSFCCHCISTGPRQLARKMWFLKHTVVEVKNPTMVFKKTCWFQDGLVWDNKFVVFCTHYNLETNAVHSFHIHWKSELVHQTSGDQSFTKKTLDAKDILKIYCVEITSQGESTTLTKRRPAVHPFLHMKQPLDT